MCLHSNTAGTRVPLGTKSPNQIIIWFKDGRPIRSCGFYIVSASNQCYKLWPPEQDGGLKTKPAAAALILYLTGIQILREVKFTGVMFRLRSESSSREESRAAAPG